MSDPTEVREPVEVREVDREIAATLSSGEFAPGLAERIIAKHMAPERAHATRIEEAARALQRFVHESYERRYEHSGAMNATQLTERDFLKPRIADLDAALEEK